MKSNLFSTLSESLEYIRNNSLDILCDYFSRENFSSISKNLSPFIENYLSYFLHNKDYKRFLFHKLLDWAVFQKSITKTFYEPTYPAIYASDNGKPPSHYNAISDIKNNIDVISNMKFADTESYDVLNWLINYRLTGNKMLFFQCSRPVKESYFDITILKQILARNTPYVCIDMGGFIGDTAIEMSKKFQEATIYSFEVEAANFEIMRKKCEPYKNIKCIHKGCGSKKQFVSLEGSGDYVHIVSTSPCNDSINNVEICSLDEEIDEKIDFIKMDIEGSELDALKGCTKHIINDHPIIAACVYHKLEDFYTLYSFLYGLVGNYNFVLRHYGVGRAEVVLYAF